IYVLHAFQKKSHEGTKTPKRDLDVVKVRLREAEIHHREHFG
ncbi:MAG TPA: type II toxin-antitoxin system RelE/ParE family toxin, partial [Armatimonadota bacterium]|nr:type II toxin-antitoxin system RelE/ParE family toxin [Armatimonadota bacterium]